MTTYHDEYEPYATEGDAHREWHRNTGVPMGTPGCPQDACHGEPDWDEGYEPQPRFCKGCSHDISEYAAGLTLCAACEDELVGTDEESF